MPKALPRQVRSKPFCLQQLIYRTESVVLSSTVEANDVRSCHLKLLARVQCGIEHRRRQAVRKA